MLQKSALLGRVVGVTVLCHSVSAAAQVTYNVFPVKSPQTVGQPANPGNDRRVTLAVHDSTVEYIVKEIASQGHIRQVHDNRDPMFSRRISVQLSEVSAMDAFQAVLTGTGLIATLTADGETVVIRPQSGAPPVAHSHISSGIIAGRVTDSASGAGLGGVSVKVEGTKVGAVTSDSGNFTLRNIPAGEQVLSAKLFGYRPAARTVTVVDGERTTVHITMVSVPTILTEVVTTATGQQRRAEIGQDVTTLNVDSIMRVAPISSVTDLLEARVPGMTVQHSSGVPGAPSRIRLRGVSSISGNNDPIIIVDGVRVYGNQSDPRNANLAKSVNGGGDGSQNGHGYAAPSPLDQIDPNDIEKIEVSKGPSASALYGSDAANGVIVITTKRGHAGPTHWALSLGQGVNWLPGAWPHNYYKFGTDPSYVNSFISLTGSIPKEHICDWYDPVCVVDSLVPFQALNDPRYSVFSHGSDQEASLTVSGGISTLTYNLTGSGSGDVGNLKLPTIERDRYQHLYGPIPSYLVRPDNYQRWSVGGALTAAPTSQTHVTLQSALSNENQQQGALQGAIAQLEGEYLSPAILGNTPLITKDVEKATEVRTTSTNILTLGWQVAPWLPINATGGISTVQRTDQSYIPYGISYGGIGGLITGGDTTGSYGVGHGLSHNQTLTVGTRIPTFRQRVMLALGGNLYSQSTSDINTYTNTLAPGVSVPTSFQICQTNLAIPTCVSSPTVQTTTTQSTFGWYVEPSLNVASRFFAAPGFRLDGGSGGTHATASGTGTGGLSAFPKIGFSYVAVEPSHPYGPVTELRPRLSFGLAGTQPNPAARLRIFGDSVEAIGISGATSVVQPNTVGNTQLRPETSRELEGGLDLVLWQGRLGVTWSSYNRTRYNAIINLPVAPSVIGGSFNRDVNIGEVRNTGTELTLTATPIQRRAFGWTVNANMSNNSNLVVKLAKGFVPNEQLGIVAGYPLFGDWARPIVGYSDQNHDGIIGFNEFQVSDSNIYVGQAAPKYQFNFGSEVTLLNGRLTLHADFAFTNGMTQNNVAALTSKAVNFIVNDPGSTLATQAAAEAASCDAHQNTYIGGVTAVCPPATAIGFYQTVSELQFNNLSVNYTLPATLTRWFRVPRTTISVQGKNLGIHTNYRGLDPNVNAFSTVSGGDETADLGQIPPPRQWWLKLTLEN